MSTRNRPLNREEIRQAFADVASSASPIISPRQLSQIIGISVKTIYEWIAKGRLHGAYRKRGKHVLLWRDRVLEIIFNGKDWTCE